jgi:hypothetical protein
MTPRTLLTDYTLISAVGEVAVPSRRYRKAENYETTQELKYAGSSNFTGAYKKRL